MATPNARNILLSGPSIRKNSVFTRSIQLPPELLPQLPQNQPTAQSSTIPRATVDPWMFIAPFSRACNYCITYYSVLSPSSAFPGGGQAFVQPTPPMQVEPIHKPSLVDKLGPARPFSRRTRPPFCLLFYTQKSQPCAYWPSFSFTRTRHRAESSAHKSLWRHEAQVLCISGFLYNAPNTQNAAAMNSYNQQGEASQLRFRLKNDVIS
ncbi:hypothetical protein X797_002090 [Metarhizium robertsii]|uniref:Uncharacterized protein n=1 Tax=Metarhizium robertsii TaxID=568076 RepID=A0A0A1V2C3_9HYPO|nr:hypothetical protein X797_002090 [Metarhizium robertsii]